MPAPRAHSQGMINQYSGSAPTLRLLCSITGGTTRAQWEDVTGSTPLTFVNDCVSFTTTVSARFWLMDCRNIGDATKMATELYKEAIHVPFMAKFVVFAKRVDPLEARLRLFCMTDDKEDKTLEHQEHFTEVAKSRDVEVLEGKQQYVEFAGNLVPITKSGEQLSFSFRAFRENRLPFSVRVKDQHAEAVSRCLFMKEPKVPKGEPPQQPICILNIVLPDDIVTDTISLTDTDSLRKYNFLSENFDYYRQDPRLADMSNLLGEDWVPLANQLGLTTSEINVIKSEYPDSVAKQAQSMLRMWLSQSGNKAQTNTLENALRRIGREDIIPQCLNVDQGGPTITRIKQEEIGKNRLKKDRDSLDNDAVREEVGQRVKADKQEAKTKLFDKYSAEEKAVEQSDEEDEESFDKPVAERREQIRKRLSAERTIPASSQRREIVQEITTIKQQNLVEDKIAKSSRKRKPQKNIQKPPPDDENDQYDEKTTSPDNKVTPGIKTVSRTIEIKTTIPPDTKVLETVATHEPKTTLKETRTTISEDSHKTAGDSELLEGVTQSFEKKKVIVNLIADEDPKSPNFAKTPPPSPADFLMREQAATVQEVAQYPTSFVFPATASASPQDDDDSLDTDGFHEDQYSLETPTSSDGLSSSHEYLDDYTSTVTKTIESQEVTCCDNIRQYYQYQSQLFAGQRKRLASTEDLDTDVIDPTSNLNLLPSNLTKSERTGIAEKRRVLRIRKSRRTGSERREDVERLQGGGGKDKIPPSEEKVLLKTTPDKKVSIAYSEVRRDVDNISVRSSEREVVGVVQSEQGISTKEPKTPVNFRQKSTSPQFYEEIIPSPETITKDDTKPTLELIIGRKEVRTKEALATAESRLTLYGTKDVEISIKSQSHISVTTTRRDTSGTETSERFDVGVSTTAGKDKRSPEDVHMAFVDKHDSYIIPPVAVVESAAKKRDETVNFSGTKQVYTYGDASDHSWSQPMSPLSDSASHHVTDTGISLTRGTATGTMTGSPGQPLETLGGLQTTGFISDTAVEGEVEEQECTDAGLSPIQADELPPMEESVIQFTDTGTSPVEFLESASIQISQVDTSEAATITDQIDMKDSSCSPIKPEESPSLSCAEKLRDDELLARRRGSGDVKARVRMFEEQVSKSPQKDFVRKKRDAVDSEDEMSSMKEEEAVLKGSTETLAQLDEKNIKWKYHEHIVKERVEEIPSETGDGKLKHLTPTHTKHVESKAELDEPKQLQKVETKVRFEEDKDIADEVYKSVRDKKSMFEELISKSQESTPTKKRRQSIEETKKPLEDRIEHIDHKVTANLMEALKTDKKSDSTATEKKDLTAEELNKCLSAIEEQVIVEKPKNIRAMINKIEEGSKQIDEPCVEPICVKVYVEPKIPMPQSPIVQRIDDTDDVKSESPPQLSSGICKLFSDQTKILESMSEAALEVAEAPCVKQTVCKLTPSEKKEIKPIQSEIIRRSIVSHAKLVSTIALPASVVESDEISKVLSSPDEKPGFQTDTVSDKTSPKILDLKKIETKVPTTEQEVQKIMTEVLEASKQIREDVKELKPDLTPTPEGQLITMLPSGATTTSKDVVKRVEVRTPEDAKVDVPCVDNMKFASISPVAELDPDDKDRIAEKITIHTGTGYLSKESEESKEYAEKIEELSHRKLDQGSEICIESRMQINERRTEREIKSTKIVSEKTITIKKPKAVDEKLKSRKLQKTGSIDSEVETPRKIESPEEVEDEKFKSLVEIYKMGSIEKLKTPGTIELKVEIPQKVESTEKVDDEKLKSPLEMDEKVPIEKLKTPDTIEPKAKTPLKVESPEKIVDETLKSTLKIGERVSIGKLSTSDTTEHKVETIQRVDSSEKIIDEKLDSPVKIDERDPIEKLKMKDRTEPSTLRKIDSPEETGDEKLKSPVKMDEKVPFEELKTPDTIEPENSNTTKS
ncbi:hypothetical protein JTB14_038272 [Gonioctena quinquepunctata]|nr:hypothetical protein JTB14_038272 [Gonioctena quinquepunctata]